MFKTHQVKETNLPKSFLEKNSFPYHFGASFAGDIIGILKLFVIN